MSYFIDVVCSIIPEPSNWPQVFEEYQTLLRDNKSNLYLQLLKDISVTENKIFLIQTLCYSLSVKYNTDIAKQLRLFVPRFEFKNDANLQKNIKITISSTKSANIQLQEKRNRLKNMQSKNKPNPNDWTEHFIYMTKFMNTKMTIFNTTVAEYCNCLQMMKEANKSEIK